MKANLTTIDRQDRRRERSLIRRRISTPLGLIAFAILLAAGVRADDLDDVTAASDSLGPIVTRAVAEEDSDILASVFTENGAVILPSGRVVRGRLTLKTSAALLFMTMGGGTLEVERQGLSLIDSTAYETGKYVFRRPGEDARQTWQGSYVVVWQREEGAWKVAVIMGLR